MTKGQYVSGGKREYRGDFKLVHCTYQKAKKGVKTSVRKDDRVLELKYEL